MAVSTSNKTVGMCRDVNTVLQSVIQTCGLPMVGRRAQRELGKSATNNVGCNQRCLLLFLLGHLTSYQHLKNLLYSFFFFNIYLFMAVLGLHFCARAFSSCGKRGPLFIAVRRPLTIAASPVAEHRLQTRRLSSCGSRAQLLRGMWDPPRPGLEPVSPALAGRSPTTAPTRKPLLYS